MNKREKLLGMIKELVAIPSVTESKCESEPVNWISERLLKLPYFRDNPQNISDIETPLEGSSETLHALVARVDSVKPTNRTVLLIGHFDVVDVECYGEMTKYAFNAEELTKRIKNSDADVLYGRGVMDMKCGVALTLDIIEDFASDRHMFDVNVVAAFVGDEENSSAGMRGVLPILAKMCEGGTDFICAVDTEPGEAGQSGVSGPMVFIGTLGKLMPSFYIRGIPAHVGNCYSGFSAALAVSKIINIAECVPKLADPLHGYCEPSWICLDVSAMRHAYSVTIPERAYVYFNCFTANNTPSIIMKQMKDVAVQALAETSQHLAESYKEISASGLKSEPFVIQPVKVFSLNELVERAKKNHPSFDCDINTFVSSLPNGDMRRRGISIVDKIADMSEEDGPYAVCFFLPPWLPMRSDLTGNARDSSVISAVHKTEKELKEKYDMNMAEIEMFAGLCDLSYAGAKISDDDISAFKNNMPGGDTIYKMPLREMQQLGMPVINMGPSGEDAHKKYERLELHYSLDILPEILRSTIKNLSSGIV